MADKTSATDDQAVDATEAEKAAPKKRRSRAHVIDLTESGSNVSFTMSHVAARQELRDLVILLQIPELAGIEIAF